METNHFDIFRSMSEHNEDLQIFPARNITKITAGKKGWGFVEVAIGGETAARLKGNKAMIFALVIADGSQYEARKEAMEQALPPRGEAMAALNQLVGAAREEISKLCHGKPWGMTIPARPENSDLVISEALLAQEKEIQRLRYDLLTIYNLAAEDIREGCADGTALHQIEANARAALGLPDPDIEETPA